MNRIAVPLMLCLVLTGCASAQYRSVDPAVKETASHDWVWCVGDAIKRLDDGVSDARSIAYGAAAQCLKQYNAYVEAGAAQLAAPQARMYFRRDADAEKIQWVTSFVLQLRAKRRER